MEFIVDPLAATDLADLLGCTRKFTCAGTFDCGDYTCNGSFSCGWAEAK